MGWVGVSGWVDGLTVWGLPVRHGMVLVWAAACGERAREAAGAGPARAGDKVLLLLMLLLVLVDVALGGLAVVRGGG